VPITSSTHVEPETERGAGAPEAPRKGPLAGTPEWLLRVSIESLLIIVSIVLALAVDEWREGRSYQNLARQSLQIFAREIEQNLAMMNDMVPYHLGLREVVADMAAEPERVVEVHSIVEGLQPTPLQNSAWETALATGAFRHIDVNAVSTLSRMYSLQQRFRDVTTTGRPELFVTAATTPEQKLEQMQHALLYLNDMVRAELELRGLYLLALEEIGVLAELRSDSSVTGPDSLTL
jgi:hypothetical protein